MNQEENKKIKISLIFIIIILLFLILIGSILNISFGDTKMPKLLSSEDDRALKGSIISNDGFVISRSKKLYKATVDTRNIDPNKKELFIKLFSTYSGIDPQIIKKRVNSHFGHVVLTYNLDSKSAKYVKQLIYKLYKLKVFIPYVNEKRGVSFFHGLNVVESGEMREFPLKDSLTPIIGYIKKIEVKTYTDTVGVYGLELFYKESLTGSQNAKIKGKRDVLSNIILDKDSKIEHRIDGYDIITSVSIKLQKSIEQILDKYKNTLEAKEIVAAVMDSKSGNIVAIASSNRFNPNKIKSNKNLSISALKYIFEPGSVMKPITLSLLLKSNKVAMNELINTHNGKFQIGNKIITDEHKYDYLSVENIIIHSSNIGIAKLAQRLDVIDFYQGLRDFGFAKKSGIDLPYELRGSIPSIHQLKSQIFKATTSYGYGIKVNFFQLLSAYNIFNNNGQFIKPTIAKFIVANKISKQKIYNKSKTQVISKQNAKIINDILVKTVMRGTATGAKVDGLIVGGKTGTAHIAKRGQYEDIYNSSFFGFANDKTEKYTIGVTVIEPTTKNFNYFASKSAVLVFKDIVEVLVKENFLTPLKL